MGMIPASTPTPGAGDVGRVAQILTVVAGLADAQMVAAA